MQNTTKHRILDALSPVLVGFNFIAKVLYGAVFSWWLERYLQRKANRALLDDVQSNLYFLISQAKAVSSPGTVLPFDYASVEVLWENLFFVITRGRGDVSISVAPAYARNELTELGPTIAALEGRHFSERDVIHDLKGVAALLQTRLALLNSAFSEQEYPRTKSRI